VLFGGAPASTKNFDTSEPVKIIVARLDDANMNRR
jgi:hypothetical protein